VRDRAIKRDREGDREQDRERERKSEKERKCVCVRERGLISEEPTGGHAPWSPNLSQRESVCVRERERLWVWVWVWVRQSVRACV